MHIASVTSLLLLASSAYAAVASSPAKRDEKWFRHLACHDSNWNGACMYHLRPLGECNNYRDGEAGHLTSIKPDYDPNVFCYFFGLQDCKGDYLEIAHPGVWNLRGKRFDNRPISWNCWSKK